MRGLKSTLIGVTPIGFTKNGLCNYTVKLSQDICCKIHHSAIGYKNALFTMLAVYL